MQIKRDAFASLYGRSSRNRTYTIGVRGLCAATTPYSNATAIIECRTEFCKCFECDVVIAKNNCQKEFFGTNFLLGR